MSSNYKGWKFGLIIFVFSILANVIIAGEEDYLSPLAVVASSEGKTVYIAEFTGRQVAVFDVSGGRIEKVFQLPDRPGGLALSPDNLLLYVTGSEPSGRIHVVDVLSGKIKTSISVGHTPAALVITPNGRTLYVTNQFNHNVSVIDLISEKEIDRIEVSREPCAMALTPDGGLLFVANLLPTGAADNDYIGANVSVINTTEHRVTTTIRLPNGSTGLRGICSSPDGQYIYVTHILSRHQMPTTQLERGWMNTNALSIIETKTPALVTTVLLDNNDLGAANPWGVACTEEGKYLCITHAGTHEMSVIDRIGMHRKIENFVDKKIILNVSLSAAEISNDLSFLVGLRQRLKLKGKGPRGLVMVGTKGYIAEYFSNSLGMVEVNPELNSVIQSLVLGPITPPDIVRKGEMFFHDATHCFQHWQSCSSCHPDHGRPDGLNWDLLNDGMGNPRNTKSLMLSHMTPPAMITGVRERAEMAVRAGIKFILFAEKPEEDALSIDEYLMSLKPILSPYLTDSALTEAAQRGKTLFEKAGCATCHPATLYTDFKKYNVGTGKDSEKEREYDTPTLIEVWRTGPYLIDGRAVTIKEVLTHHNSNDKHGKTSNLTEKEINDLEEFILSL